MVGYGCMRYMGIDYGTKRVGIALSDEAGLMAFPEIVLPNDTGLVDAVEKLATEKSVGAFVLGHSIHTDGTPNQVATAAEEFMTDLTLRMGLPVHLQPEQYSTQEAKRYQGKTDMVDAAAAAIILNNYLLTL